MSAIDVNAYHIVSNQEKSKPHHIHVVQNILLFQPVAGSIFPIEYCVSSKSWLHNFQRLFWETTSGLYGCFCPSWTISGYRESFGLSKTFFGIPSAQHVSIWANCYCIWGMLFAVMSACCRRNRWTSTMDKWLTHLSSHVFIAHRRYNNIQSFGFSIFCLSKMKNKLRR